jgi:Calcium-activated chloride channel
MFYFVDEVRRYYGEGVGFYFAFLEMLTWALLVPSCIGLIHHYFLQSEFDVQILFCVLYMLWAFILMEVSCITIAIFIIFVCSIISRELLVLSFGKGVVTDCVFSGTRRANMEAVRVNREQTTEDR